MSSCAAGFPGAWAYLAAENQGHRIYFRCSNSDPWILHDSSFAVAQHESWYSVDIARITNYDFHLSNIIIALDPKLLTISSYRFEGKEMMGENANASLSK